MGYLCIKRIFNRQGIVYDKNTIIPSVDLKISLENFDLEKKNKCAIISLDIKNMYTFIKFGVVKKAINLFSKGLDKVTKDKIKTGSQMIKFVMSNTLINFRVHRWIPMSN